MSAKTDGVNVFASWKKSGHDQQPSRPTQTPWNLFQTANWPPTQEEQAKDWRYPD